VGLLAVNLVKPGAGITLPTEAGSAAQFATAAKPTLSGVLEHTVPQSFFEAATHNEVLQIVFFSILFAVSLARVQGRPRAAVREPWLIAFTTASSEAALPRAMQAMEAFGVPRRIVAFVMPTGYSFNLDGSTLYLALASVFVAQAANIDMSIGHQLLMMLTL